MCKVLQPTYIHDSFKLTLVYSSCSHSNIEFNIYLGTFSGWAIAELLNRNKTLTHLDLSGQVFSHRYSTDWYYHLCIYSYKHYFIFLSYHVMLFHLSIYIYIYSFIHIILLLYIHLSIYPIIHLLSIIYLSIHVSIYLSIDQATLYLTMVVTLSVIKSSTYMASNQGDWVLWITY